MTRERRVWIIGALALAHMRRAIWFVATRLHSHLMNGREKPDFRVATHIVLDSLRFGHSVGQSDERACGPPPPSIWYSRLDWTTWIRAERFLYVSYPKKEDSYLELSAHTDHQKIYIYTHTSNVPLDMPGTASPPPAGAPPDSVVRSIKKKEK